MIEHNENYLRIDIHELYDKMISILRQRGFYDEKNKDFDPCHFLTEQEQIDFEDAIGFYNMIPF